MVDDACTEEDIEEAFKALQESDYWVAGINNTKESMEFCIFTGLIVIIGFLMFLLGTITKALSTQDFIFLPFLVICFILVAFFSQTLMKTSTGVEYLTKRQTDFNERLRELNKSRFLSKGFRFEAGEMGAWIELQFMKEHPKLGRYHRQIEKDVEQEINDELANEMYLSGLNPCQGKSWQDF